MNDVRFLTTEELDAGLEQIRAAPRDNGRLELIVRRPSTLAREVVERATLDVTEGLVGDNWLARGNKKTPDGAAHPEKQITIMNVRVIALIAPDRDRWALAGDQLYVDMDLGQDNLPVGARLAIGGATLEITEPPHTGCKKFVQRFGADAMRFVNSAAGKQLRLRGVHAVVVDAGEVALGDRAIRVRNSD